MSENSKNKARVIAYYLPQFHPVPENDEWWGKGFTEWRNVGKAKPLFKGHYQPRVPADLGYYDLRVPETRKAQADLAKEHGIEGFCYWHYWFGNGKRLLERPFNEVLASGEPDFPFCLAWANESWKGFAHGLKNRNMLIEQLYPGVEDYTAHFYTVLQAFKDDRYIQVDGKPLFVIYLPLAHPEVKTFMECWRKLAKENGLKGIYFVGQTNGINNSADEVLEAGVDAVITTRLIAFFNKRNIQQKLKSRLNRLFKSVPLVYSYKTMAKYFLDDEDRRENIIPSIIPGWDHTPRSGVEGLVISNTTPEFFEEHASRAIDMVKEKDPQKRIVFLKSWNEWAEGNYIEPDLKWGMQYLQALKRAITNGD
ncbi:glycosyltransferase WbsX family protein [Mucilaginibacter agri]|uniref:Lipopolysaccharide biosynthesis protein n=1 Tax=Mucilaginibacter agri TaxID=2695265 RepID=A0A965ZGQ1_9SPHI|nr:glycoside hydrolase family 99-like domain-containing protein [Mucilaginibacter agri]NCD70744.1 lipopolysaccharide biosynthesis protein [Mucilaginibacter agri]